MTDSILKLQNGSDVRGIALEGIEGEKVNLTSKEANVIAQAFVRWLENKSGKKAADLKIAIGRDSRLSGPDLEKAAASGIKAAGAEVVLCGLSTTPSMFMSLVFEETKFDGSVMITASHLPFNRNGLKFFDKDGGLEHDDITSILQTASGLEPKENNVSATAHFDLISLYASHLTGAIKKGCAPGEKPLSGLHIIVDSGNGASGFFVDKILKPLGADTEGSQFLEPDGHFPNHIPNPENKEAMESIKSAVIKSHADLGLIFDTDVDRMSAVLDNGEEVNRDSIIALISAILAPENKGATIVTDSVTSDRLTYFLEKELGLKHLCYMRGYKNVINKQKELNEKGINCPLAMETSGHGALKENWYLDDGAYLAVKMIIALAKAYKMGKKLGSLIEKLPPAGSEGEYRFKIQCEDFKEYGKNVLKEFKKRAEEKGYTLPENFEGVRLSFKENPEGWLLLRMSLHDPVMPLNIEGKTEADREALKKIAAELLEGFDKLDKNCIK
ncbi:MAG: phosphomannomutase/phosphoglucomutase [Treponema sp.]|nr:phosphomannomutase/phosphoglucomutase [Treponema sp.]